MTSARGHGVVRRLSREEMAADLRALADELDADGVIEFSASGTMQGGYYIAKHRPHDRDPDQEDTKP